MKGSGSDLRRKFAFANALSDSCRRSGLSAEDIIFDPTSFRRHRYGEHNNYAVDYINANALDQANLPHAKVSGAFDISFSFAEQQSPRTMAPAFLYHAIAAGHGHGIASGNARGHEEIEPELKELVEDVLLNRARTRRNRPWISAEKLKTRHRYK